MIDMLVSLENSPMHDYIQFGSWNIHPLSYIQIQTWDVNYRLLKVLFRSLLLLEFIHEHQTETRIWGEITKSEDNLHNGYVIDDSNGRIFIFFRSLRLHYDFNVLSIPFQQLIQNVDENANFGYSLEDLIKW